MSLLSLPHLLLLPLLLLLLLPPALTSPTPVLARATQVVATATGYCFKPAPWTQILSFFLTNYIARVATFKKTSGYEGFRDYTKTALSLFVPFVGISQAAATIARGSRFLGHDDVERALLAEALCVIVRDEGWRPEHGEVIRGCAITAGDDDLREKLRRRARKRRQRGRRRRRSRSRDAPPGKSSRSRSRDERRRSKRRDLLSPHAGYNDDDDGGDNNNNNNGDSDSEDSYSPTTATLIVSPPRIQTISEPEKWKVQGFYTLPPTYALALLPPETQLRPLSQSSARKKDIVMSNSYGVVEAFAGAVQIVSSLYTLYSANADQVQVYGYAALGFTVLPYTIMSVLNTIANLVEASYDCLFLVRSDVMVEAEKRERGEFIGEVAELVPASKDLEVAAAATATATGAGGLTDLLFTRAPTTGMWHAQEVDGHDRVVVGGRRWRVHIPHDLALYKPADDPRAKIRVQPLEQAYAFSKASHKRAAKFRKRAVFTIMAFSLITPYLVVGGLSRFKRAESSVQERVFVTGWLVVGQVIGALNLVGEGVIGRERRKRKYWSPTVEWGIWGFVMILGFAMAIGGFTVVGRQLRGFGFCINA